MDDNAFQMDGGLKRSLKADLKKPLNESTGKYINAMPKKSASKTHFVMVTFGVSNAQLEKQFLRLAKRSKKSASAFGRELIQEGIDRRLAAAPPPK